MMLFIIDVLISKIFYCPSYLFLLYIPRLKIRNIWIYLFIIYFYDLFFLGSAGINVFIVIILFILNKYIIKNFRNLQKTTFNYLLYFFIMQIIFKSVNIIDFMIILIKNTSIAFLATHVLDRNSIDLIG